MAVAACAAWLPCPALAQPRFGDADIHSSAANTIPQMRIRLARGRYELRNATLVDLIRTAWGVDAGNVVGGPDWLDTDRFDVIAPASSNTAPETLRGLLQGLLKDRFHLSLHNGTRDQPVYQITIDKKPALEPADGSEPAACRVQPGANPPPPRGAPPQPVTLICRNMTMAAFAKSLPGIREASGYLFNYPVLDRTGLPGAWNFSLRWHPRQALLQAPPPPDTITIFAAFEKQLGLKLSMSKVSNPVVVVDRAEKPSANPPGVTAAPLPRLEFEVADIKPDPLIHTTCSSVRVSPGGMVRINMTLQGLILETLGENNTHRIAGGPKSMDDTCFVVVAKAPFDQDAPEGWNGPVWNGLDIDTMRAMLRALLDDRFRLSAHLEDRMVSGYALVAAKPRLRKADPSNRPGCSEGPGPDGKDPRLLNPLASRLVTCRNMTLSQFARELNHLGCGCAPVVDATGIEGRYDITINFSPPTAFPNTSEPAPAFDTIASDPTGALSIFEAVGKQLGLKLQPREVPTPVFVIDYVNESPTDN